MDNKTEIRDFLVTRRARITPEEEFRIRWAAHDVYQHTSGEKRLHHPVVGDSRTRPCNS